MPILQRHGFPATLYLVAELGGYARLSKLAASARAERGRMGYSVAHHDTPASAQAQQEEQREEILRSACRIEQELGKPADTFAYPYGEYNRVTLKLLRKAHFQYAFTTHPGWASSDQPPLELHRIVVDSQKPFEDWVQKLSDPVPL